MQNITRKAVRPSGSQEHMKFRLTGITQKNLGWIIGEEESILVQK